MAKLDAPDGPYAALFLAKAGMVRLGMGNRITSDVAPPTLFHAVSQGALGVEIRSDDAEALTLCKKLTHRETAWRCSAERACLRVLEGGCSVPVGVASALAASESGEVLTLTGCVTGYRRHRSCSAYSDRDGGIPRGRGARRGEAGQDSDGQRCKEDSRRDQCGQDAPRWRGSGGRCSKRG